MSGSCHGNGHHPDKQSRNHCQGDHVEGTENLEHEFGSLSTTKALSPRLPALTQQTVEKLFACICLEQDFIGCRDFTGHDTSPILLATAVVCVKMGGDDA